MFTRLRPFSAHLTWWINFLNPYAKIAGPFLAPSIISFFYKGFGWCLTVSYSIAYLRCYCYFSIISIYFLRNLPYN